MCITSCFDLINFPNTEKARRKQFCQTFIARKPGDAGSVVAKAPRKDLRKHQVSRTECTDPFEHRSRCVRRLSVAIRSHCTSFCDRESSGARWDIFPCCLPQLHILLADDCGWGVDYPIYPRSCRLSWSITV